jgi:hypothetical protein
MRRRVLALALLVSTGEACSVREDVAGIIARNGVVETDGLDSDAGTTEAGGAEAASALIVIGQPLGTARWAHPIATWPLSTPLREFFADDGEPSGKRVRVEGPDASALDGLWQAVKRGEYGPQMSAAVVQDAVREQYLLVFQSP